MDSDAKLNILTEALAAAGASALAIDARGDVAISTMNDAALERDVALLLPTPRPYRRRPRVWLWGVRVRA